MSRQPINQSEWAVLDLLLDEAERPKAVEEIVREIGSLAAVADALDALRRSGIIHHVGDLVFVTPSGPGTACPRTEARDRRKSPDA